MGEYDEDYRPTYDERLSRAEAEAEELRKKLAAREPVPGAVRALPTRDELVSRYVKFSRGDTRSDVDVAVDFARQLLARRPATDRASVSAPQGDYERLCLELRDERVSTSQLRAELALSERNAREWEAREAASRAELEACKREHAEYREAKVNEVRKAFRERDIATGECIELREQHEALRAGVERWCAVTEAGTSSLPWAAHQLRALLKPARAEAAPQYELVDVTYDDLPDDEVSRADFIADPKAVLERSAQNPVTVRGDSGEALMVISAPAGQGYTAVVREPREMCPATDAGTEETNDEYAARKAKPPPPAPAEAEPIADWVPGWGPKRRTAVEPVQHPPPESAVTYADALEAVKNWTPHPEIVYPWSAVDLLRFLRTIGLVK